jgi:hypothetical protein
LPDPQIARRVQFHLRQVDGKEKSGSSLSSMIETIHTIAEIGNVLEPYIIGFGWVTVFFGWLLLLRH